MSVTKATATNPSLDETLPRARELGITRIELSTGGQNPEPFLDVDALLESEAERRALLGTIADHGMSLSALNVSAFPLHPRLGGKHVELTRKTMRLAGELGVDRIIAQSGAGRSSFLQRLLAPDLPRLLREHLALVFASLAIAAAIGIPLGVLAQRRPHLGAVLMAIVGMAQTIPSLALLAFLIAIVGTIGFVPALLALSLYALLPIVRNTHAGLVSLPEGMRQAGLALGLRDGQVLRAIELPLAGPTIFAGIKTAAVLNVGVATVATFIGAGGLGERIVAGLAVNDTAYMLAGAVPAALLALVTQWVFDLLERWLRRPRHSPAPAPRSPP
jgi:ABC-type proline/glycine betaine transport system permease subunit